MMGGKRRKGRKESRRDSEQREYLRQPCIFNYRNEDQTLLCNRHNSLTGHLPQMKLCWSLWIDTFSQTPTGRWGMLHRAEGAPSVTISQHRRSCRPGARFPISHSGFYLAGARPVMMIGGWWCIVLEQSGVSNDS